MKCLVTGASGLLGSGYIKKLMDSTDVVVSLTTKKNNINSQNMFEINWDDLHRIIPVLEGVDTVINFAGPDAGQCNIDYEQSYDFAINKTLKFYNSCVNAGVKKFIHMSTAHVYGNLVGKINEDRVANPIANYGRIKLASESALLANERKNTTLNVLRLSNVVCGSENIESPSWNLVVNDICKQIVENGSIVLRSNGEQYRDFLSFSSFCELLDKVRAPEFCFPITNISSSKTLTIKQVINRILEIHSDVSNNRVRVSYDMTDRNVYEKFQMFSKHISLDAKSTDLDTSIKYIYNLARKLYGKY